LFSSVFYRIDMVLNSPKLLWWAVSVDTDTAVCTMYVVCYLV